MAIEKGNIECVQLLIQKGANLSLKTCQGLSPLHVAAKLERIECIKCIVDYINERVQKAQEDSFPAQTSSIATGTGQESGNKIKWDRKLADTIMNETNQNGHSLLHVASMNGNIDIIGIFAENGADVTKIDWFGNTPLHLVLMNRSLNDDDREEACKSLLKAKADFMKKNLKRRAPIDFLFLKSLKTRTSHLFEENFTGESQTFFELLGICLCMLSKWFCLRQLQKTQIVFLIVAVILVLTFIYLNLFNPQGIRLK